MGSFPPLALPGNGLRLNLEKWRGGPMRMFRMPASQRTQRKVMKMQKLIKMLTITGLVVGLGAPLAKAADETRSEQRGQLTAKDYKFLSEISQGGTAEVELGELAKKNGGSQVVRDFGQRMATDHGKANT